MADELEFYLSFVKKDFSKSFKVNESHLSAWLAWHETVQGKWLRARLALSAGVQLGFSTQTSVIWAVVCELIHSASLLHDDVCDQDTLRRGKAALWKEFGIPAAICTGDFLIAEAFRKITEIEQGWHQTILLKLLSCTIKELTFGQSRDVTYKPLNATNAANTYLDDWQQYCAIATQKTAPLISLPVMGMLHCTEAPATVCESLKNICKDLGLAYQLLNDLENILAKSIDQAQFNGMPSDIFYGRANSVVIQCMIDASLEEKTILSAKNDGTLALLRSKNSINKSFALINVYLAKADTLNHQLPVVIAPILSILVEELRTRSLKLQNENDCK